MAKASEKNGNENGNNHPADSHKNPWDYLLASGWLPLGNPRWETTLWRDPRSPVKDEVKIVPVLVHDGQERIPLMRTCRDGSARKEAVVQRVHMPAGQPMSLDAAILIQSKRDLGMVKVKEILSVGTVGK